MWKTAQIRDGSTGRIPFRIIALMTFTDSFDYSDEKEWQNHSRFTMFSMAKSHAIHLLPQRFCPRRSKTGENMTNATSGQMVIICQICQVQLIASKLASRAAAQNLVAQACNINFKVAL